MKDPTGFYLKRIISITRRNLRIFKTRVLLTVFGIFIGVAALICTSTLSKNLSIMIEEDMKKLSDNTLLLSLSNSVASRTLGRTEVTAIQSYCPALAGVSPSSETNLQITSTFHAEPTLARGVGEAYFRLRHLDAWNGRVLLHFDSAQRVAVLGKALATELFGNRNAVGQVVGLSNGNRVIPFRVVGVLMHQEPSRVLTSTENLNKSVFVPHDTLRMLLATKVETQLLLQAKKNESLDVMRDQVIGLLKPRFGKSLQVVNPRVQLEKNGNTLKGVTYAGLAFGILCLLSGGVGIMNVMYLNVFQRRREIGLYKAIGFTDQVILMQFVSEALAISCIGLVLGILVGIPAGRLMCLHLLSNYSSANFQSVGVAAIASMTIGLVFGYFPARQAAVLDPAEALKGAMS